MCSSRVSCVEASCLIPVSVVPLTTEGAPGSQTPSLYDGASNPQRWSLVSAGGTTNTSSSNWQWCRHNVSPIGR